MGPPCGCPGPGRTQVELTEPDSKAELTVFDKDLVRREAEIRSGKVEGEPAESVFARLRCRLREHQEPPTPLGD
jgi:hypothetical protein